MKVTGGKLLVALGLLVAVDGICSILIGWGQYHGLLFDLERVLRTAAGLAIAYLGAKAR